jgi:two-component system nitrogen regulation sensor histidine kinase NtrY
MAFNRYIIHISARLILILVSMFLLVLIIHQQGRVFSILVVSLVLILLVAGLFRKVTRTNRIIESMLEAVLHGDLNRRVEERVSGLGFEGLADSAQQIIRAIASARIEKETQYRYLQTILEHIHTAVITLDAHYRIQLVNPLALYILGIYHTGSPAWEEIEARVPAFTRTIRAMGTSGREMIRLPDQSEGRKLLVLLNTVKVGGDPVKIITFQDIEPEMDQQEMESWKTISRIMAHEIMNSLTPLSSLTDTGIMLLRKEGRTRTVSDITQKTIDDLFMALRTISDRNQALIRFIGNYRQLSRLPAPELKEIRVGELLEEIRLLYEKQLAAGNIRFSIVPGPSRCTIMADETQVKQVLINLVKNAMEALDGITDAALVIRAKRVLDRVIIEVSDNGPGIPDELRDQIFVPFFSTKTEGSGIGLSLCRQIVNNHGGQISMEPGKDRGTIFRVGFPCPAP